MPAEKYSIQKKRLRGVEQGMPDGIAIDRTTGEYLLMKIHYPPETAAFILDISVSKVYDYVAETRPGHPRLQASCLNGHKVKPMKVTRASILDLYAQSIVPNEKWGE
jgi:hypothetical protein